MVISPENVRNLKEEAKEAREKRGRAKVIPAKVLPEKGEENDTGIPKAEAKGKEEAKVTRGFVGPATR